MNEIYDPQHTMLALNMAIVSVHRILSTEDRIVLEQEYTNIINNLSLGNIESDKDMTILYRDLLGIISRRRLREEDREFLRGRYDRMEQKLLKGTLGGVKSSGRSILTLVGGLAVSCISSYFSYKYSRSELAEGLSGELWQLTKEDITDCNALQERLLNSSWNLLRQYKLPDNYRLVQRTLDDFYKAVNEKDPAKRFRMLRALERDFQVYPPYWYYRGKTAQELGENSEAHSCFARFNEVWRPVLRQDPYKVEALKFELSEIVKGGNLSDEEKRRAIGILEAITENTPRDDWANNIFAGVAYFVLGEKDRGIEIVQSNVDFGYGTDVSWAILTQLKTGELNPAKLSSDIAGMLKPLAVKDRNLDEALTKYFEGKEDEAEKILRGISSTSENPVVFYVLGDISRQKKNEPEADKFYERAGDLCEKNGEAFAEVKPLAEFYAEKGRPSAQIFLGDMHSKGFGTADNDDEAVKWYRLAAEQGDARAQYALGRMYNNGEGVAQDKSEAFRLCRLSAEQGYAPAQLQLGFMYKKGYGVAVLRDYAEAMKWYRKSAEQDYAEAQSYLGLLYENGEIVQQDYAEAVKWYCKAAENGDTSYTLSRLSFMLRDDIDGIPGEAKTEIFRYFLKAAEHGDTDAEFHVGFAYHFGCGVSQDYAEAVKWYNKAAEKGYAPAQCNLGFMYEKGYGVNQDYAEALNLYHKSAEQGNETAQYFLGKIYSRGEGVKIDCQKAYMWYSLATLFGLDCTRQLNELEKKGWFSSAKVSPSEAKEAKAEAQRKYNEIRKRYGLD